MSEVTNYQGVPVTKPEVVPVQKQKVVSSAPAVAKVGFFDGLKNQLVMPIVTNIQQYAIQIISNSILNAVSDLVNGILWGKGVPQQRYVGQTNYNAIPTMPSHSVSQTGSSMPMLTLPADRVQLFRFKTREDASLVQDQLLESIRNYGKAKLYDYYVWSGHPEYANPTCNYTGWTDITQSDILTVSPMIGEDPGAKYILRLPDPVRIE